jgi:hypothetical protein
MKKMSKAMYGKSMMKTGGSTKMKKYAPGGIVGDDPKKKKDQPEFNTPVEKKEVTAAKDPRKTNVGARLASVFTGKKEYTRRDNPVTGMNVVKTFIGGKKDRVVKDKIDSKEEKKMGGSAKPKAMYGKTIKASMMKMGGAKKK